MPIHSLRSVQAAEASVLILIEEYHLGRAYRPLVSRGDNTHESFHFVETILPNNEQEVQECDATVA
jgi:hypothetical protein